MSIADTLQEYYNAREWQDEIRIDEENNTASSSFTYSIEGQAFETFFEIDEGRDWLMLYMYAPNNCPAEKRTELLELLNYINSHRAGTCLVLLPDGRIRQQYMLDVEGGVLSAEMIHNLLGTATVFEAFYAAIMSVIFTDKTADQVIREIQSE